MKSIASILVIITFFAFTLQLLPQEKKLMETVEKLYKEKNYSQALEILDKKLAEQKNNEKLLAAKFNVLMKLNRLEEALQTAIKRYEAAERKSPWRCIDVVSTALKLKNTDLAFQWLEKAVERGFLSYSELYNDEFALLKKDKRFNPLIEKIKANIGIGKTAKDFTIKLLSGKTFTLSSQKGRVVLVDFWATWCRPCVKGMPHLKEFYRQFHDQGFDIIGISLDSQQKHVEDFIAAQDIKWNMAFSGKAWADETARQYNVNLIPSYWLIDKNGVLRDFGIHLRDKDILEKAIDKLIR
jgi:peroxiredoxin